MRNVAGAIAGIFLFAGVAGAEPGPGPREEPGAAPACHPAGELEAAKAALARGDRKAALHHLRRADAALAACARDRATPIPELESDERALAQVTPAGSRSS
jgi:hypothetical protein